ncbi:PREDICTED: von Willebrand factor A domain-containing protein 9-like [Dipodomys ordii]|uniref:von Willebrand factor A domain-containing protein 9 n=1 Tax=Dipodomys ordii TaxID=10020 RepID=A0A1S3GV96_DIPOR|nr:PREDICTED: von Willebrand factor A domain-containing protein 9-like [Dipodomys ordii]
MPTVVVMDVSLSMTQPVSIEGSEEYQRKHLAAHGLTMLFEHMATNYKLEFTALVVFSSLWELMVRFTRDYNTLQVVLVTDGCLGIGRGSLRHSLATHNQRSDSNRFPLPFPFPSKLYIMCMANLEEVMPSANCFLDGLGKSQGLVYLSIYSMNTLAYSITFRFEKS